MELQGKHVIPLPRPQVWAALNDADVLRACIPGCQALTKTAEDRFTATVASKIGPVSAVFTGEVQLLDIVSGLSYTISGSGKGGVAGFAKGRSQVVLADGPEGTILSYTATAEIGGKLASVGSRLLQGVARRTADDFFTALVNQLAPAPQAVSPAAQPAPELGASRPAQPAAAPAAYHPAPPAPAPARTSALPWILAAAGWLIAAFLAGHLTH
jgi:carbon monoxide dehydrogenase subunit G